MLKEEDLREVIAVLDEIKRMIIRLIKTLDDRLKRKW